MNNILGRQIIYGGKLASYDAACKRLLSNRVILAWILKSCLKEYRACEISEIAERYLEEGAQVGQLAIHPDERSVGQQIRGTAGEDVSIGEGTVSFDIRFCAWTPGERSVRGKRLIIDIEAQKNFYPGYPIIMRGVYYGCRMISSQHGVEFTDSQYGNIKKVYSIWICMKPPKKRRGTINRYCMQEEKLEGNAGEAKENYDLLEVIMICLGEEESSTGILRLLEVLLSSVRSAAEKIRILQEEFQIATTGELEQEVRDMCNLSEGVLEQGIEIGLERGKREGHIDGIFTSLKNLMESMNWSAGQAMDALKIPKEERERYGRLLR